MRRERDGSYFEGERREIFFFFFFKRYRDLKFVFEGKKKIFISIIFLIMLMCKNVGALKVLVLYVYIDDSF